MKKSLRILTIVLFGIIALAGAVRLLLPWAAVKIANRKLPGILNTAASIGDIQLGLLRGYISIRDLRIAQPESFGEGDLLVVPAVTVKVKLASLISPPLTVEEIRLTGWEVNLVKNREGVMNLEAILPQSSAESEPADQEEETAPKPIRIRRFLIDNLAFSYIDYAITAAPAVVPEESEDEEEGAAAEAEASGPIDDPPAGEAESTEGDKVLRIRIAGLDLAVDNLLLDPAADPAEVDPASAVLTARLLQEPFSEGLLGLSARVGPLGSDIPALNAVLRLGDLELEPIDVIIPAGTVQALGGDAVDIAVDLSLAPDLLDCEIIVEVAGGHVFPLAIGGTPDEPKVDSSSLLLGVMLHLGGGMGRLVGNVGGAGYQLAAGATETTWAVGKGAVNVVGSVGGGLFKTVTSAATGDLAGAADGLSDTTVGTAATAAAAAGDVAGEVAEGAAATADSTTGADGDRRWREETPRRWEESWRAARRLLAEMPFPPPPRPEEPDSSAEGEPAPPTEEKPPADDLGTQLPPVEIAPGLRHRELRPDSSRGGLRPAPEPDATIHRAIDDRFDRPSPPKEEAKTEL